MKKAVLFLFLFLCVTLAGASASAQTVVVNKYFNTGVSPSTGDVVELLVIENNLDMRGMIVKDFSSSMANDGGGKYQFSNAALWASVPAGTLIVLRSVDPADWNTERAEEIVEHVLSQVGPGDIVCLHDGVAPHNTGTDTRAATAAAVAQLVPALLERDLRPVTVSELLAAH